MVDFVKEFLQVHIHDPSEAALDIALRLQYSVMCSLPRSETVAVPRKVSVKNRIHDLQEGLLEKPVHHGRDA